MSFPGAETLGAILVSHEKDIVAAWVAELRLRGAMDSTRLGQAEVETECGRFLRALRESLRHGSSDAMSDAFAPAREALADLSRSRAVQGFSPKETALFLLALKQPLNTSLETQAGSDGDIDSAGLARAASALIDDLGVYTFEVFQQAREQVIIRQQREISELSTPVIKLWQGILALPLIGTLDSERTQVVMENLLDAIVQQGAEMAIIDITGVPTVDTLTAHHLLKTIAAARLMGADCIVSGIRPQIAQTMVHLGVELSVVSKATLADAFALALARQGRQVVRRPPAVAQPFPPVA